MSIRVVVYSVVEPTRSFREVLLDFLHNVFCKACFMFVYDYGCCGVDGVDDAEAVCYPAFPRDIFYVAGNVDEFCSVSR